MSKYIISKEVYTSIVKAAEKAKKFFANLSGEEMDDLNDRVLEAADNENHVGWVANSVPLVCVDNEVNKEDGTPAGLRPMTAAEMLKVGPEAIKPDGSAIVAFIRDEWKLPRFAHPDKEGWTAAAILNQKDFEKPYLIRTDIWNDYYAPIRAMIQEEGAKRDELDELIKAKAPKKEIEDLKATIEQMEKQRLANNCLRYGTYKYWYNRREGDYPFIIACPEKCNSFAEAYENSILGLKTFEFNAWKDKFRSDMLERAKECGEIYRDITDVEEADRRMERWLETHKTLEAEDEKVRRNGKVIFDTGLGKVTTIGGMTKEECLIEAFKNIMNKTIGAHPEIFGYDKLSEENEKGSNYAGWGEIVSLGYLPFDYNEKQEIYGDRSRWKKYMPTKDGRPATIWAVFWATGNLVGEGLPLSLYLSMTGAPFREWKNWQNYKKKQAEEKTERAETFDAWKAAVAASRAKRKEKEEKAKVDAVRLANAPF